jgi:hypothetical protein
LKGAAHVHLGNVAHFPDHFIVPLGLLAELCHVDNVIAGGRHCGEGIGYMVDGFAMNTSS